MRSPKEMGEGLVEYRGKDCSPLVDIAVFARYVSLLSSPFFQTLLIGRGFHAQMFRSPLPSM